MQIKESHLPPPDVYAIAPERKRLTWILPTNPVQYTGPFRNIAGQGRKGRKRIAVRRRPGRNAVSARHSNQKQQPETMAARAKACFHVALASRADLLCMVWRTKDGSEWQGMLPG
jgi:hypothetical protein